MTSVFLGHAAFAGPIIVGHGAGESEYSILFARTHIDDLLAVCAGDQCHFSPLEKDWLRTTRELAQHVPEAIFKTKKELGALRYLRHPIEHQVWFNQDLLWLDAAGSVPFQVSDAVALWMDILLVGKDIPKTELAILEFELAAALNDRVQSIFSSGDNTGGFTAILWTRQTGSDDIYFRDQSFQTFSGLEAVRAAALCGGGLATQIKFHSGRWTSIEELNEAIPKLVLRLEVSATWTCGKQSSRGRVQLVMNAFANRHFYEINQKSIRAFLEGD